MRESRAENPEEIDVSELDDLVEAVENCITAFGQITGWATSASKNIVNIRNASELGEGVLRKHIQVLTKYLADLRK